MDFEAIKKALGMERLSCLECERSMHETDGEYGEIDCGWFCYKEGREHVSNLKNFPFITDQKCCDPGFWHTRFCLFIGEDEERNRRAFNQYLITLIELGLWEMKDD